MPEHNFKITWIETLLSGDSLKGSSTTIPQKEGKEGRESDNQVVCQVIWQVSEALLGSVYSGTNLSKN